MIMKRQTWFSRRIAGCLVLAVSLWMQGCIAVPRNTVTRVFPSALLNDSGYDGRITCEALYGYGDSGIGVFDRLDGEMLMLDGKFFRVKPDGNIIEAHPGSKLASATVVNYAWDRVIKVDRRTSFAGLRKTVDAATGNTNGFYALKIKGKFLSLQTTTPAVQKEPYMPMDKVRSFQKTVEIQDVSGTIFGFRLPEFVEGVADPGYHCNFVSRSLSAGGHVLDFVMLEGTVEIDACDRLNIVLP